jgi:CRP/FNR family cyclic AMP-dependent transcriptional regulator
MSIEINSFIDFFERQNVVRTYDKKQVIISQGDPFSKVFMVKSGMIKMYDLDSTGAERTITIFGRHSVFPIMLLLDPPPAEHIYFYEAFTNVDCYVAPLALVSDHLGQHPNVLVELNSSLVKAYLNQIGRVQNLEKSHTRERLQFVLYYLATALGTLDGKIASIDTALTQEDIARLAGVTRESVSIEINKAESRGLIRKDNHTTYIDLNLLDTTAMPAIFSSHNNT